MDGWMNVFVMIVIDVQSDTNKLPAAAAYNNYTHTGNITTHQSRALCSHYTHCRPSVRH
jgi:hypothetical protein